MNIISFDVEEWFQVENLSSEFKFNSWNLQQTRIYKNINLILEILHKEKVTATFFVLGWIAQKHPEIVKMIYNCGHEISSHGFNHISYSKMSLHEISNDITESKKVLEDLTGDRVIGFRAPNFSISESVIEILWKNGFIYDSSYYNNSFGLRYGKIEHKTSRKNLFFEIRDNFYEFPLSSLQLMRMFFPWSGGFYFRLIPTYLFKFGVKRIINNNEGFVLYLHPWEFDSLQPRVKSINWNLKFRHYYNLKKTQKKFENLISNFKFTSFKEALLKLSPQNMSY